MVELVQDIRTAIEAGCILEKMELINKLEEYGYQYEYMIKVIEKQKKEKND